MRCDAKIRMDTGESKKEKKERKRAAKELKEAKRRKVASEEPESGAENGDELEIDLSARVPLSKKQQRLLKKGKLNLDKIDKKHPAPKPENEEPAEEKKKSEYGVWIGNLAFDTTKEDLIRYIVSKTLESEPAVKEEDMSRINLPKKDGKIKGFAYVDLPSSAHVETVVALSEGHLNGRRMLIKSSSSFEGRPEKPLSKNPPSRILFVGNLSFDTTSDLLEEHFRHCGEIVKIRMATFEDSGKCKGFAFVDFKDEAGPTAALKSKLARKFINRPLRLEYGEDRSKRTPKRYEHAGKEGSGDDAGDWDTSEYPANSRETNSGSPTWNSQPSQPRPQRTPARTRTRDTGRIKSSVALATAQRASAAIVPSAGKRTKFD